MPELGIIIKNGLLTSAAQTTLNLEELINNMIASGMSKEAIRNVLLGDLNSAGPIFGHFRNSVKSSVADAVGMAGNGAAFKKFEDVGVKVFQWVTAGSNSCPDCIPRHGDRGTMEYFELIGIPKSGFSVCGGHCQCTFVPVSYKGENLDKPLMRQKN